MKNTEKHVFLLFFVRVMATGTWFCKVTKFLWGIQLYSEPLPPFFVLILLQSTCFSLTMHK